MNVILGYFYATQSLRLPTPPLSSLLSLSLSLSLSDV